LEGHTDSVYCVRIDSKPGSRDRTIKIWDGDSGMCLCTLTGHEGSVLCMDFDEEVLLTGSSDSNVFIWDLTKIDQGKEPTIIKVLTEHTAGVLDVNIFDHYVMTCSKDATCRVYDRHDDYKTVHVYRRHGGPVNAGGISSLDGVLHAVTASGEGSIQMWNLLTGELIRTFDGHTKGLACVDIIGHTVISGSSDHTVRVWDAKTGECLVRCDAHTDLVRAIAFDDVRKILISAGYDGHVKLFDLRRHLL
ncbi:WD40 repeat-like protein, partial [Meira miltonrushii]